MNDPHPVTAVLRADGTVVAADDGFTALLGPDPDRLLGSSITERVVRSQRDAFARALAAPHRDGAPTDLAGLRLDGLPWCARLGLWSDPSSRDDNVLATGCRRFGPVRWSTDAPEPLRSGPGVGLDSVLSHDVRGALRSASGFVTVVQRTLATPTVGGLDDRLTQAASHLEIAARSVANADDLAAGLVQLMRWADEPFVLGPVVLGDVIDRAAARSHEEHPGDPAEIRIDGELPAVLADEGRLEWALAELVTNARRFHRLPGTQGRPGSPITVGFSPVAHDDDRFAAVAVRHAGIGVAPALEEDAFLPGRKLQPRGDYPGVGMGLALCRLVFERHAGWCRIGRAGGSGTAVHVSLPLPPLGLVGPEAGSRVTAVSDR